jgi:thiopeptide-type bacteriocin biosynthesis protein
MLLPSRAELAFQIHAASPQALRYGDFRLLVTGTPRSGSSMAGRFAGLLPDADRARLAASFAAPDPDAVVAQLSFPPRQRRTENVVRTPQLLAPVISLSEHRDRPGDLIALDDLAVTADARRLWLVQISTGRRVEPRVLHALEPTVLTPPLARFLAEITAARCAVYKAFDWAAAAGLPYLPRLRYGRTVLSPARWLLTAVDLPPRTVSLPVWEEALHAWRQRLRVPAAVTLYESGLRLPLNLGCALHRTLLRARLHRARQVELREGPAANALGWIGRAHELLLPLRLAHSRTPQPEIAARPRPVARDAGHLPGRSSWLHAQVHGHPDRQDEILADHLPGLLDGWDDPPLWWFRRHRHTTRPDLDQHLELYLRLPAPQAYGTAAARVGEWAADLRVQGLVAHLTLATYHPESGRYGHGPSMAAAEEVFAADSTAALAQIRLATGTRLPPEAVTAAGLLDLATAYSATPADGLHWLIDHLPRDGARVDRPLLECALRLADPGDDWAELRAQPGGQNMALAWQRRRAALAAYRDQLARQQHPHPVLRSLLHLHYVRAIGVNPDRERVTHHLARAAALRQTAHHRAAHSGGDAP